MCFGRLESFDLVLVIMNKVKPCEEAESDVSLKQLIRLMTDLLNDLVEEDDDLCESVFNSASEPAIPITDFLLRLHKYTHFSAECLIIAVIYIDRYNLSDSTFSLNRLNIHKLVLAAVLLAAKYQDDFYYDNKAFQFAGGVNALHLHHLQLELFQKLDYNLFVSEEDYQELRIKIYEVYSNPPDN